MPDTAKSFDVPEHIPSELVYPFDQTRNPEFMKNPYKVFERIGKEAPPIFYAPSTAEDGRGLAQGTWCLTRAEDVREALQHYEWFTTSISYGGEEHAWPRKLIPLELDPPEHTKYRALLAPLFSPKSIDRMESDVREVCTSLMDRIADKGECEFMTDFARPYPATIFMKLMGLPMEDQWTFVKWEEMALNAKTREEAQEGGRIIANYLWELIQERRKNPKDDIVTTLTKAQVDGKPVADEYIHDTCMLLFLAGLDTVTAGHMHSFRYLAMHPEKKQELIDNPDLIPNAVEELLRYHSWVNVPRTVAQDLEFRGIKMKRGDRVQMMITIADHDASEFPDPEKIDFHREPNPHMAFSAGVHRCAGSHLARRELRISIREWLKRMPDFHVKEGTEILYQPVGMFYPAAMHLEWSVK